MNDQEIWDLAKEAEKQWWKISIHLMAPYLYYSPGKGRILVALEDPGGDWVLAHPDPMKISWTRDHAKAWVHRALQGALL